MKIEKMILAMG